MNIKTYKRTDIKAWETTEEREKLYEIANQLRDIGEHIRREHPDFDYLTSHGRGISSVTFFAMIDALMNLAELQEWTVVENEDR